MNWLSPVFRGIATPFHGSLFTLPWHQMWNGTQGLKRAGVFLLHLRWTPRVSKPPSPDPTHWTIVLSWSFLWPLRATSCSGFKFCLGRQQTLVLQWVLVTKTTTCFRGDPQRLPTVATRCVASIKFQSHFEFCGTHCRSIHWFPPIPGPFPLLFDFNFWVKAPLHKSSRRRNRNKDRTYCEKSNSFQLPRCGLQHNGATPFLWSPLLACNSSFSVSLSLSLSLLSFFLSLLSLSPQSSFISLDLSLSVSLSLPLSLFHSFSLSLSLSYVSFSLFCLSLFLSLSLSLFLFPCLSSSPFLSICFTRSLPHRAISPSLRLSLHLAVSPSISASHGLSLSFSLLLRSMSLTLSLTHTRTLSRPLLFLVPCLSGTC